MKALCGWIFQFFASKAEDLILRHPFQESRNPDCGLLQIVDSKVPNFGHQENGTEIGRG